MLIETNEETMKDNKSAEDLALEKIKSQTANVKNKVNIPQESVNIDSIVVYSNNEALGDAVTTEITKNEEKKREHKDLLLKLVAWFLGLQFGLFFLLLSGVIVMIVVAHMVKMDFSMDVINSVFDMLKMYLTSIIVEMISMLYFIVRNVFDTTIPDLAKQFATKDSVKN